MRQFFTICTGIILGALIGYLIIFQTPLFSKEAKRTPLFGTSSQVIGFLPYWLIGKADSNSLTYVSTLTYFGLTIDTDGSILKLSNPQEAEPGWHALKSGVADKFLTRARNMNKDLSLLVFKGNSDTIDTLMEDPIPHAKNLMKDVVPVMKNYGFSDLNIDIERVGDASDEARMHFTQFIKEVRSEMNKNDLGTLTIELSPTDIIKHTLISLHDIAPYADYIVLMGYDYHYSGSIVSGPVAPISGGGETAEYDVTSAVRLAISQISAQKLILGVPLYGYEWETIDAVPRSGIIPGTGLTASTKRVDELIASCATCSAQVDGVSAESYIIYKDEGTGTYHQVFYPDEKAMSAKISFAKSEKLGGLALWALGYEGKDILKPLKDY